jgi:hypothetical protein
MCVCAGTFNDEQKSAYGTLVLCEKTRSAARLNCDAASRRSFSNRGSFPRNEQPVELEQMNEARPFATPSANQGDAGNSPTQSRARKLAAEHPTTTAGATVQSQSRGSLKKSGDGE